MMPRGYLLAGELLSCEDSRVSDSTALLEFSRSTLAEYGFSRVYEANHCFEPVGQTLLFVLTESHFAIHTFPEASHISLDLFHCSDDADRGIELVSAFCVHLRCPAVRLKLLSRGSDTGHEESVVILGSTTGGNIVRGSELIVFKRSMFQNIVVVRHSRFGVQLYLDADLQVSEEDSLVYSEACVPRTLLASLKKGRVLIIGGGDGGILKHVLEWDVVEVTVIEIDPDVISTARLHLRSICGDAFDDARVRIIYGDGTLALTTPSTSVPYDVVVSDLTDQPLSNGEHKAQVEKVFEGARLCLRDSGTLSVHAGSARDKERLDRLYEEAAVRFRDVRIVAAAIPSFDEPWAFLQASGPIR